MLNCLMYKLCYYRFDEVRTNPQKPAGYDALRGAEIGVKNPFSACLINRF